MKKVYLTYCVGYKRKEIDFSKLEVLLIVFGIVILAQVGLVWNLLTVGQCTDSAVELSDKMSLNRGDRANTAEPLEPTVGKAHQKPVAL